MPNKLIGTLIALFFFGLLFNISTITLTPTLANAQLSELTEIQNGTFHLSHKNMGITSETFKNDKYIDDEQAEFFTEASRPKINTPADDNYPFTLVDHYLLDSDLAIVYNYDCLLHTAYPKHMFLSRHNISIADYTDQKSPPEVFLRGVKSKEPYHGKIVTAAIWTFNNYELSKDEMLQKSAYGTDNYPAGRIKPECYSGYAINTYVKIISGNIAVWVEENPFHPTCPPALKTCRDCLPKSACPEPETKIVKWNSNPTKCIPKLPRPKSNCVTYPKTRNTQPTPATSDTCITCK